MLQKFLIAWAGLIIGVFAGYFLIYKSPLYQTNSINGTSFTKINSKREVVGFLPFWLSGKAQPDYSGYITTLNYFNLTIDSDGTILKQSEPGESDPGWHTLMSGSFDNFLENAKQKGLKLSLTVFSSNDDSIEKLISDPVTNAQNLTSEVIPIMRQFGFTDLNLDVEMVSDASPESRIRFAQFVSEVKRGLDSQNAGTLTIDISPIAFVKEKNIVNPKDIISSVDYVILMAYDFHNPGSLVTGPVSPETGAGIISEFDTESAVLRALTFMTPEKLILGIPLYGYQWESINPAPRSATIPGSSIITSNLKAESFMESCASCSATFDGTDKEEYVIYKDQETGTYHQLFYPDIKSTQIKADYAKANNLGGIAVWALGYEGKTILTPLKKFIK